MSEGKTHGSSLSNIMPQGWQVIRVFVERLTGAEAGAALPSAWQQRSRVPGLGGSQNLLYGAGNSTDNELWCLKVPACSTRGIL